MIPSVQRRCTRHDRIRVGCTRQQCHSEAVQLTLHAFRCPIRLYLTMRTRAPRRELTSMLGRANGRAWILPMRDVAMIRAPPRIRLSYTIYCIQYRTDPRRAPLETSRPRSRRVHASAWESATDGPRTGSARVHATPKTEHGRAGDAERTRALGRCAGARK